MNFAPSATLWWCSIILPKGSHALLKVSGAGIFELSRDLLVVFCNVGHHRMTPDTLCTHSALLYPNCDTL